MNHQLRQRATQDDLLSALAEHRIDGSAYRSRMKRFVCEQGPKLQRLAAFGGPNCEFTAPDEIELSDPPCFRRTSDQTLREARSFHRTMWVVDLARQAEKVWLWAWGRFTAPFWCDEDDDQPWHLRGPNLRDVMGSDLIHAVSEWALNELRSAWDFIESLLARFVETSKSRTAAGIVALISKCLSKLTRGPAALDRTVEVLTERVRAPGGTLAFALRI